MADPELLYGIVWHCAVKFCSVCFLLTNQVSWEISYLEKTLNICLNRLQNRFLDAPKNYLMILIVLK